MDSGVRQTNAAPAVDYSTQIQRSNAALLATLNPGDPNYRGPGWEVRGYGDNGGVILMRSADPAKQQAQNAFEVQTTMPAQPAVPTTQEMQDEVNRAAGPPPPLTVQQQLGRGAQQMPAQPGFGAAGAFGARAAVAAPARPATQLGTFNMPGVGGSSALPGNPTSANPEAGGPAEVDRTNIDKLLGNVSKATSGLAGLAATEDQYSAAQAQLAQGLAQGQANSLALARSGNRRDAAGLGARALQVNSEMAGEATRSSALLRAQEEDQNKRLKLDAFKAAGDLGLNASALEVDVNNLNMQAATSYLNNLFETNRLGLQLDEAEAARVTNFIRDMALVEKDYYAMSLAERASFRDDLTRRYGISETTKLGLQQLDKSDDINWGQMAMGFVSGAAQGGTAAGMSLLSDERMKTGIADTTDAEFEELVSKFPSKTYTYTGKRAEKGKQFGGMAQALLESELGRGMVDFTSDGTHIVDGGKAGMAALSGLSKVWSKLKELEAAL